MIFLNTIAGFLIVDKLAIVIFLYELFGEMVIIN
jgi:hypothetical protein